VKLSARRALRLAGALFVGALLAGECTVRLLGYVDFPVYDADARIGYIPKAGQRGSFMNKNDWVVNEHHMGAEAFVPGKDGNVLLVGDSVVWGGNPYAQPDRLGPRLQALVKARVWPIAAGSWGLQNQVTYLNDNPGVVRAVDTIVFVSNSGDFGEPSSWTCELSHPQQRPLLALVYLARKYVLKQVCPSEPAAAMAVPRQDPVALLKAFVQSHVDKRVMIVLYPNKAELDDTGLLGQQVDSLVPLLQGAGVREIVRVGTDPDWQGHLQHYRDNVHPTPQGNAVLAAIIARQLRARESR